MYPNAYFLLTGADFPESNAHAANENLELEYTRKFTTAISLFLSKLWSKKINFIKEIKIIK